MRAVQGNDSGGLREASRGWRALVNELATKVGRLVGEQYRDEAAATFEAASVDDALADILRSGRFTAAVTPAGFGLAGMPEPVEPRRRDTPQTTASRQAAPDPDPEPEPEPEPEVDEAAIASAREALAAADKKVEQALHRLRRAEQRLDQAREAVDDARLAHQETLGKREELASALEELTS